MNRGSLLRGHDFALQVGTNYDTKEELFRNYPGFFGPHSTGLTLQYMWKDLAGGNVTFLWVDPSGNTVSALETNIGPRILSGVYKLETNSTSAMSPLLTGVWKLKVQRDGKDIAVLQFLVIPSTVSDGSIKQASHLPHIDKLTALFWKAENLCSLEDLGSQCPNITRCSGTNWSSMSPDLKSDIIVDKIGKYIK